MSRSSGTGKVSRIKSLDQPSFSVPRVEMPLMETIGLTLPELDSLRPDTEPRPVLRSRDGLALKFLFVFGDPFIESGRRLQWLALPRGPRSNLTAPFTRSEVGISLFIRNLRNPAFNSNLDRERRPIEAKRGPWVRDELSPFSSIVARVENESALVERLEQDDSYVGLIAIPDRPEGHCVRFGDYRAVEFLGERVDAAESLDRIRWDQLIPRHRRIDLVDPAQNTAREIPDVGHTRVRELVGRVHAADADLAVKNCLPPLVESRNLVRNPVERNETRAWYVAELPFVRFPDIYDLEFLSPVEALRQLRRLDFSDRIFSQL